MKTCPVCGMKIEGPGIPVAVDGRQIVVCSEECAEKARASMQRGASPGQR